MGDQRQKHLGPHYDQDAEQCTVAPSKQFNQGRGNAARMEQIRAMQGPTIGPSPQAASSNSQQKPKTPENEKTIFDHYGTSSTIAGAPDLLQSMKDINVTAAPNVPSGVRHNKYADMGFNTPTNKMNGKFAPGSAAPKTGSSAGRIFGAVDNVTTAVDLAQNVGGVMDSSKHFNDRLDSGVAAFGNGLSYAPNPVAKMTSTAMSLQMNADQWRREHGMLPASDEVVNSMNSTYDSVNGFFGDNAVSSVLGHTAAVGVGAADSLWEGTKNYGIAAYDLAGDAKDLAVDAHGGAVNALAPSHVPGEAARTITEQQRTEQILKDRGNRGKVTWTDAPE